MACNNCNECNPCSQSTCVENHDCECKIFLKSDCIEEITEEMSYLTITAGKTFNEWILALNDALQDKFTSIENFLKLKNIGLGAKIYKGISILGEKEIKSLTSTDNSLTITENTNSIDFSVPEANQDNFVRQLFININDLPNSYTEQDVCDYILTLPEEDRTILETDSKWNIVIIEVTS